MTSTISEMQLAHMMRTIWQIYEPTFEDEGQSLEQMREVSAFYNDEIDLEGISRAALIARLNIIERTVDTTISEAQVEAAGLAVSRFHECEDNGEFFVCQREICTCRNIGRAALTAAAQVGVGLCNTIFSII